MSGETISLRFAVDFLHVIFIKYKQILVLNLIFDLLWTGEGSLLSSVTCLGFHELK